MIEQYLIGKSNYNPTYLFANFHAIDWNFAEISGPTRSKGFEPPSDTIFKVPYTEI